MKNALNKIVHEGRIKSELTLRQAAKKLGVPAFYLKRLEYGYYTISDKMLKRMTELYGLDEAELAQATQSYAAIIDKPKKGALAKIKEKRGVKIALLCVSAVVAVLLVLSAVGQSLTLHNASPFFSNTYKQFSHYMEEHGGIVSSTDEQSGIHFSVTWNTDLTFGYPVFKYSGDVDEEYAYEIVSQPLYGFEHGIEITYRIATKADIENGDSSDAFDEDVFGIGEQQSAPSYEHAKKNAAGGENNGGENNGGENNDGENNDGENNDGENKIVPVYIAAVFRADGTLDHINQLFINGEELATDEEKKIYIDAVLLLYETSRLSFDHFFSTADDGLQNFSYAEFIGEISKTCYTIVIIKIVSFIGLLVTVAAIYPLLIWDIKLLLAYIKRKREERGEKVEDDEEVDLISGESTAISDGAAGVSAAAVSADADAQVAEVQPVAEAAAVADSTKREEKEHKFPLVLHERVVRLIGLIALALGSSTLIIAANGIIFNIKSGDSSLAYILSALNINSLPEQATLTLNTLLPFFRMCTPIAVILLFFVKIDIMTSKTDIFKSVFMYAFIGLYLYFVDFLLLAKVNMLETLLINREIHLSGNMFLGITAYTLFAAFMLYTPEFAKKTTKRTALWHSLAIIPLAYIIVGSIVIPRFNVSPFVSAAFYSSASGTMSTLFVIFYVLLIFVLQVLRRKKYAQTPIGIKRGKSFYFMKNVAATVALILAITIDVLLSIGEKTAFLSSGASWISLAALPFILFYQPRLEPRKSWENITYIVVYFAAYGISVLIGAIYLLANPYTASLVSILRQFIRSAVKAILLA